ncbi:uncharacterized protein DUF3793 [Geobacter argillaceus]|uniref:Uncharacterized protein DUF3793 n=2 Tax=Geobacter argillaceus TaxID=345631 RepID=A0A562WQZ9_9BACT|nr:uncharacterized protein DUF3793 [Geobacter argillaceus]
MVPVSLDDPSKSRRPIWHDVSARFIDPSECLASFLALEAAEVLEGAKPANLISVGNRKRSCGRNLYELWRSLGGAVLAGSGLMALELADRGDSVMLLLYSPLAMQALLERSNVLAVLRRAGYAEHESMDEILDELASRVAVGGFPHEIGVFLGYPLKDVAAFMGWVRLPFVSQGPWKIYGDPGESLRLAATFRCCRKRMAERLESCASPFECLGSGAGSRGIFC